MTDPLSDRSTRDSKPSFAEAPLGALGSIMGETLGRDRPGAAREIWEQRHYGGDTRPGSARRGPANLGAAAYVASCRVLGVYGRVLGAHGRVLGLIRLLWPSSTVAPSFRSYLTFSLTTAELSLLRFPVGAFAG